MTPHPQSPSEVFQQVIGDGVAGDAFYADEVRALIETLDPFVEDINRSKIGQRFLGNCSSSSITTST